MLFIRTNHLKRFKLELPIQNAVSADKRMAWNFVNNFANKRPPCDVRALCKMNKKKFKEEIDIGKERKGEGYN